MMRYIIVSFVSGILFGTMDGLINGNPFAQRLLEVYKPIAKTSMNIPAGIFIDLIYGFVMAGIFIFLYKSLPGGACIMKGISFGLIVWFFRVAMYAASQWMMFKVPNAALLYILFTGLAEMLILGMIYGLTLNSLATKWIH
jgi:hypothetical protein